MYVPSPFITLYVYVLKKNYLDMTEVGAWDNSLQNSKAKTTTHTEAHILALIALPCSLTYFHAQTNKKKELEKD